jgi:hypothetical protein
LSGFAAWLADQPHPHPKPKEDACIEENRLTEAQQHALVCAEEEKTPGSPSHTSSWKGDVMRAKTFTPTSVQR